MNNKKLVYDVLLKLESEMKLSKKNQEVFDRYIKFYKEPTKLNKINTNEGEYREQMYQNYRSWN